MRKFCCYLLATAFTAFLSLAAAAQQKPGVQLADFRLEQGREGVVLQWTVSEGRATCVFEVERSSDGLAFTVIATLAKSGAEQAFRYLDGAPLKGTTYYRLRLLGPDGAATLSSVLRAGGAVAGGLWEIGALSGTALRISGLPAGASVVQVYTTSGALVYRKEVRGEEGHTIDLSRLRSGPYILRIGGRSLSFLKQ